MGLRFPAAGDREHLGATIRWLCTAQDATGNGGVSAAYSLHGGWDVAYPETSGYILATFLAAADVIGDAQLVERARRIGDWEIAIQAASGGILSRPGRPDTRVFNTGQVILGWLALFEHTRDERYLGAAQRAGDYLVGLQEPDGTWQRDTYCGARTYHARTDWGLLKLARLAGDDRYADAARRNLRWVMRQQQENGWFRNCGFHDDDPITHVIDYTLIGVLESALVEPAAFDRSPVDLVRRSLDAVCCIIEAPGIRGIPGMIPASFDAKWRSRDRYSCLTGNAQLAYTLLRVNGLAPDARYAAAADKLIRALKHTQALAAAPASVRGALPGSYPMHAGYFPDGFPNWGAKFFADALLASLMRERRFAVSA
jgi:uncharacterized protein YyaL (SSP411 family)